MADSNNNDIVRKRRTYQKYLIEHEGQRMPIQGSGSDFTGIDPDTFWDQTLDGNPLKFYQKNHEIKMLATIINRTYWTESEVNAQDVYERIKLKNKEMNDAKIASLENIMANMTGERFEPDGTRILEKYNPETKQLEEVSRETPPKLPDDFKGIRVAVDPKSYWSEAQILFLNRQDLDLNLPMGLPPEVINECREISMFGKDKFLTVIVSSKSLGPDIAEGRMAKTVIFITQIPIDSCVLSLRGRRDSKK